MLMMKMKLYFDEMLCITLRHDRITNKFFFKSRINEYNVIISRMKWFPLKKKNLKW